MEKTIVRSSNYSELKNNREFEIIKLDEVENYYALLDKMGEIDCREKTPLLKFEYSNIDYELVGFYQCPKNYETGCYFRVNRIYINNDSLYTKLGAEKTKESIDNLGKHLENIISKPYNYRSNENRLKRGLVSLSIDKKYSISMTKKVLSHVANEFKKINDSHGEGFFEYSILYKRIDFWSIPPPPLPPK